LFLTAEAQRAQSKKWGQRPFFKLVSHRRGAKSAERYRHKEGGRRQDTGFKIKKINDLPKDGW
jgi:hypothetical protein